MRILRHFLDNTKTAILIKKPIMTKMRRYPLMVRIHDMLIISFGIPFAGESYRDLYPILSPYPIYRRL